MVMRQVSRQLTLSVCIALGGCATTQGASTASTLLKPLGLETTDITDVFSGAMRSFRKQIDASDFAGAEALLLKELEFFTKRLGDRDQPLSAEFLRLGEHIWASRYEGQVKHSTQILAAITGVSDRASWPHIADELRVARTLKAQLSGDRAALLLRVGESQGRKLDDEIVRVAGLVTLGRAQAIASTFDSVLATGMHDPVFVEGTFGISDYRSSGEFQRRAVASFEGLSDREAVKLKAAKLSSYLSDGTRLAVDTQFMELAKRDLLADGRVSLEELAELQSIKAPFGGAANVLADVVRVGFVDLTSASFKNRNIFDFEISFQRDLPLTFTPADESLFRAANWPAYDYVFVTDLAVAKVSREFKSRNQVKSRMQTGTRQDQNPKYVGALSAYQTAMSEYQSATISAAAPKPCTGLGCLLIGIADGLAQGNAKRRVDETTQALSNTSQTVTTPVYGEYTYQSVDINASKTADVNYYVVDIKGKQILRSNFQVSDGNKFNVAYNVRDEDPDRSSIQRNVQTEDQVTAWEKRVMEVRLSALFNLDSLRSATATPLIDAATFLASLSAKEVVAATPTYASNTQSGVGATATLVGAPVASSVAQTIADDRFDSIVIVQNPNSIGAGFYVTPELVLTAHHVVQGNSLTQITFYNGTKTFGKVVAHDIRLDLALIRAQTTGKPLKIFSGPIRLGETVEAIGHPKGYEFTITRGVISAVRRQRSAQIGSDDLVEFVQTDTPISQGNSGGPLLLKDAVIGVNDWIRVDKGSQNLNFSVSYNEIRAFLDRYAGK